MRRTVSIPLPMVVTILTLVVPAVLWLGRLEFSIQTIQKRINAMNMSISKCASKEVQDVHDVWIRSWTEDINDRLKTLENRK